MCGASKIIFIVGNSRSGTTMLGRILGNNRSIYTFEELHFFENMIDSKEVLNPAKLNDAECRKLLERLISSARSNIFAKSSTCDVEAEVDIILGNAQRPEAIALYKAFVDYETQKNMKTIPCKQTPRYLFSLDEVFEAFPTAQVINMIRDPRDVMLSQKNKWRTYFHSSWRMPASEAFRTWANYHPILIAKIWSSAVRRAKIYELDPRFVSVRFEDLLESPESTVAALCDFLGVDYQPEMIAIEDHGSSIVADEIGRMGINQEASGRWKYGGLSQFELGVCQRIAGNEMRQENYAPEGRTTPTWRFVVSLPLLFLKGGLALLLNLSRNRDVISAIMRRLT